jgi:cytochrome c-type biogenesis protein CcmH
MGRLSPEERQKTNNALPLFYLRAASLASGDKPAAVKRWRTLLALLPSDAPIRAMLEQKVKEAE